MKPTKPEGKVIDVDSAFEELISNWSEHPESFRNKYKSRKSKHQHGKAKISPDAKELMLTQCGYKLVSKALFKSPLSE